MLRQSMFLTFALSITLLQACGAANTSHSTGSTATSTGANTISPASVSVANFDGVVNSNSTRAYVSLADANHICQEQAQAINALTTQLQQSLAAGGDVQTAIAQFNSALETLATCIQSQAQNANMPTMPQVDPNTAGSACSVSSINGQVTQTGDCGNCQVTKNGSSVSAACNGSSASTNAPAPAATAPTIAPPAPTPPAAAGPGNTITSNGCSVNVVNGQTTTTGDCSNCKVQNNGGSVSVNCSSAP